MKPFASISLDLDNQWSYMKTHGDREWETFPSYFPVFIPYVLDILERLHLKITFFVVGQDAALDKNKELLALLGKHGHEIGNHSFHHEPWLHLYSKDQIAEEIHRADEQLTQTIALKPVGFRGPGFSWSADLLEVLAENKYLYDASLLPTYIGPFARLYFFWTSDLSKEEKNQRKALYGSFKDGLRPVKPYAWRLHSGSRMLEIPVTTLPILKLPFHLSYLLYLSRFSSGLMSLYLKMAITLCQMTRTEPSFLLHPLDLLGGDQVPQLAFFPGMDVTSVQKVKLFETVLQELAAHFTLVNMSAHARAVLDRSGIREVAFS